MSSSQQHAASTKVKIVAGCYALQQRLGSGSFATVYKGVRVPSSNDDATPPEGAHTVAIKAITRSNEKLTKKVLENLEMEINILRTYKHPNIVCLQSVQKTERHFYLILEYCGGGDLQRLIRTRKAGRLSEGLSRRLMRDLGSGLKFLWRQEVIHRDLKPQNLLLSGPLPMDEVNDPAKMDVHEEMRQKANFPSDQFCLKIADFGFARHLQTTSLAETLCGSPLYMAPEILQHHRYDAKADLWSVGTVLFEMIAGKPPFNGENHIDLLRNIQRKAVRLPTDVRVSKECVTLLRILLNRNPLSRAGFKEFFDACEAFVALGCEGISQPNQVGTTNTSQQQPAMNMDLGTIHEDQGQAASLLTVATDASSPQNRVVATGPRTNPQPGFATPPLGPVPSPTAIVSPPPDSRVSSSRPMQLMNPKFAPLQPSPPHSTLTANRNMVYPPLPKLDDGSGKSLQPGQIQLTTFQGGAPSHEANNVASQSSNDDSEFVMVEHGMNRSDSQSPSASGQHRQSFTRSSSHRDYMVVNEAAKSRSFPRGMLSTSPGTGGMLVALMGGRPRLLHQNSAPVLKPGLDTQMDTCAKMIAAAEDVGRRSVSVAHLGDTRAYMAMKCLMGPSSSSSVLSSGPMQGVVEADDHADVTDCEEGSSNSTEMAGRSSRRRTMSTEDRSMPDLKEDDDEEEMPFAIEHKADASFLPIPSRSGMDSLYKRNTIVPSKAPPKMNPQMVRSHFAEALSCYLKALSMIKGVLGAVQKVNKDIENIRGQGLNADQGNRVDALIKRAEMATNWLSSQFAGVLERADAANGEISKLHTTGAESAPPAVTNVAELIYNQSLACGRDAAVKQLLGQHDAARSCYRTAGLLAETLMMEPNLGAEDRKVLEGYVDGFSARITELDGIILQQSRALQSPSSSAGASKRGSGIIGIIGGIPPPTSGYGSVLPPMRPPPFS